MSDAKGPTLVISHPEMIEHDPGVGHPERPARLAALINDLSTQPIAGVTGQPARPATDAELLAVHTQHHVARLAALAGRNVEIDPDTRMSTRSHEAARLAAGGAVAAVEAVFSGAAANAFLWARPPGHHAESGVPMGFCLFNNVAVAAAAGRRLGAERIVVVDWDVHHGNGTQQIFARRPDVLTISTHQYPLYPGTGAADETGEGEGRGRAVNCPLPAGQTDADYGQVFDEIVMPIADAFRPQLVLVSAGFDAHVADPLGDMRVTERGFAAMCTRLRELADRHAEGRLVLVLEGGYDLEGLVASSRACLEVLTGTRTEDFPSGSQGAKAAVAASRSALAPYWPTLGA